jgi:autotransporter-associated beta strand protein
VTFNGGILNTSATFSSARGLLINVAGGATVNVDSATTFTTTGVVSSISGAGLTKTGTGTMVLGGASANTHSGLTTVSQGTLRLAKTSGNAIATNVSIGDGNGAATLVLDANEQIANGNVNVFSPTSTFNLNGFTETVGTVTMSTGTIAGNGGTLTLGGNRRHRRHHLRQLHRLGTDHRQHQPRRAAARLQRAERPRCRRPDRQRRHVQRQFPQEQRRADGRHGLDQ